jgi:hypothetical protein
MKPISEFTKQDGILIETEQESQEIRELLHGMGLKWYHKAAYIDWEPMSMPFVIYPSSGTQSKLEYAKKEQKTLHPASDYIIKPGDEVEVRDFESLCWLAGFKYLSKTSIGKFAVEDMHDPDDITIWNQIRKNPNPKAKAIAEIKKIAEDNGINLKEI